MDARLPEIADQLLLIERALRALGFWSAAAPNAEALASAEPFCMDTLRFEEWLQWVFLPRMKVILEQDEPLPSVSGIAAMAEMVYVEEASRTRGLIEALNRFDLLIASQP